MKYAELQTKKAKLEYMKTMLTTSDRWMLKALYTIYMKQTSEEQQAERTELHNGVGFTGVDGEILTSFAKQFVRKGGLAVLTTGVEISARSFFSDKQLAILRKKMPKYARQLVTIAEAK